jgi:acyl-CoA thioesterase I
MDEDMRRSINKWLKNWFLCIPILGAALLTTTAFSQTKIALLPATTKVAIANTILIVGDSLSAEYGLPRGAGWVHLLEQKLNAQAIKASVINAAISGDTSFGGLARLPALLAQHQPSLVVIELGGNDALRGLALNQTEQNLSKMVLLAKQNGAKVLILGMQIPPNFGSQYAASFIKLYERVAQEHKTPLVPFLLKNVHTFQPDGIHPTSAAQPLMLDNVWPSLRKLLHLPIS